MRRHEPVAELTPRARDSISSLGERLSAPLVAAALAESGVASEAIEATELVLTDSCHGSRGPCMDMTGERCEARLHPLLQKGVVPVVTGFIGATAEGVLTTLGPWRLGLFCDHPGRGPRSRRGHHLDGRGRPDDGGPTFGVGCVTIPEISYREAAELAHIRRQGPASENSSRGDAMRVFPLDSQHILHRNSWEQKSRRTGPRTGVE